MVSALVEASAQTSRLGALYDRAYAAICGAHPNYWPWHFQYLFLADVHPWQRSRMAQLKGRVLDVGCGRRPYEAWLDKRPDGVREYIGLDVAPGPGVDIVVGPDDKWPLADASIDGVLLTQVLEHVADRRLLVEEISRVLRPGGTLLLTVPFIFPLHGLPHDYARFTPRGVSELFARDFEEGEYKGLGVFGGDVIRFADAPGLKIPHMGWNTLRLARPDCPLFAGLPPEPAVYFVHSYYPAPSAREVVAAEADYPGPFCAAVWKGNVFATQFHPEKRQRVGLQMLRNFAAL